ncbi:hypothetical protein, partial [Pediococcus pentosaceus]
MDFRVQNESFAKAQHEYDQETPNDSREERTLTDLEDEMIDKARNMDEEDLRQLIYGEFILNKKISLYQRLKAFGLEG